MEKVTVLIVGLLILGITASFRPPLIINSIETIVLFLRDIGLALTYPKYFHNDPRDYKPLPFESVLKNMSSSTEENDSAWIINTEYEGEKRPTTVLLVTKYNPDRPSVIYHHGAGSTRPLRDFDFIFGSEFKEKFNVFVVWAQYHTSKAEYLTKSVDSFLHHQETFAGSVLAYEEIVKFHKKQSEKPVIAAGSSMGGIVSSLHAFYFGTADYYFPIVAYPNVGEIFLGETYKYAVEDIDQKRKNGLYFSSFAVEKFDKKLTAKVFPIIGTKDKVVPSNKALEFWEERGFDVLKYPYGHFTSGIVRTRIRETVLRKLADGRN
ncbi:hypothetical protein HYV64_02065 [Candidatus Shapirobacteria bacterium]|nr:hypothetical protein [Candidatus Shapirobacteria bacterium]